MDLPQTSIIQIDMLSHSYAFSKFRFFVIRYISSSVKDIFSILLLVLNSKEVSWLLLVTGVQREAKYEVKRSDFSEEPETTQSLTKIGGIMGNFLLLKNVFKIDQ